jgi:hypothetical protein
MVPLLVPLLSRPCAELVVTAANLLRKLSVVTVSDARVTRVTLLTLEFGLAPHNQHHL